MPSSLKLDVGGHLHISHEYVSDGGHADHYEEEDAWLALVGEAQEQPWKDSDSNRSLVAIRVAEDGGGDLDAIGVAEDEAEDDEVVEEDEEAEDDEAV